jgi:hypothetical protein
MCDHFGDLHLNVATFADPSEDGKVKLVEQSSCPCVKGGLLLANLLSASETKVAGRGLV